MAITGGCLLAIPMLLVFVPLSLPLHFIIKAFNGRGFSKWDGGKVTYNVPWWACLIIIAVIVLIVI